MAISQNGKRHGEEVSQVGCSRNLPPAKKIKSIKTRSEIELDAWSSWTYPPEFWDRLSKVKLTRRALKEFGRRIKIRRPPPSPPSPHQARTSTNPKDIIRFARHGGPDLCHLRGYPEPIRETKLRNPACILPTSSTSKTEKSAPYGRDFDQHMTDHQIYPLYPSPEPDLTHIEEALAVPRLSLSPSRFPDNAIKTFQREAERAKDEDDILADILPTILGPKKPDHPLATNTVFGNLEHLTDGTIAAAKPDMYFGSSPEELALSVRVKLSRHIVPSVVEDKPIAPNFFVEVKGPDVVPAVVRLQARYDGAIGSRAIHSLQNYGKDEPVYDNNPYTFSATYIDGFLKLYAHHLTAPTTVGGPPEYHMTQINVWAMTSRFRIDEFRRAATAVRNARDLAKHYRDRFIKDANAVARQVDALSGEVHPSICEAHDNAASSSAIVNHPDHPRYMSRDAQDGPEREIRNQSTVESLRLARYLEVDEDSRDAN